jgi:hypothetical protein
VGYAALSSVSFFVLSSHNSFTSLPLHDHLHGFEVVSLHFEVGGCGRSLGMGSRGKGSLP